jgi:hypothetical protein
MLSRRLLFALALTGAACGPTGGEPPAFLGLEDQEGFVGSEIFFEVRATDAELTTLAFSMASTAPTSTSASLIAAGNGNNGNSALFRWTPTADDVGVWIFDFIVSDGVNETVESIAIEVRSIEGGAPVFRQPLGAGTTLDLTEASCLSLAITVEDPDSVDVQVTQDAPMIEGATLTQAEAGHLWEWCPSQAQIDSGDSFVLALAADDGEHLTLKHFVIVLRNGPVIEPVDLGGFTLHQAGAACSFELPAPLEVGRGDTLIIARDSTRATFQTFWGVTLPASTVFINAADACPRINGDESFVLNDSAGQVVDGPTPIIFEGENMQRVKGSLPAGEIGSWTFDSTGTVFSPGTAPTDPESDAIFISEISDALGSNNFVFEFVEIAVD